MEIRIINGSKLVRMPKIKGFVKKIRGMLNYRREGTATDAKWALRGAMKSQHLNHKTLEVKGFVVIVGHNVML